MFQAPTNFTVNNLAEALGHAISFANESDPLKEIGGLICKINVQLQGGRNAEHYFCEKITNTAADQIRNFAGSASETIEIFEALDEWDGHVFAEWHTHPGGCPSPSEIDKSVFHAGDRLIILSRSGSSWLLNCWDNKTWEPINV